MRILLTLWFFPLVLFWGWYALSVNDISFGFNILTRDVHDLVFQAYGNMLGMDPEVIPGVVAAACAFDTSIVLGIAAIRWRSSWWPQTKALFLSYWGDDLEEERMDASQKPFSFDEYSPNGRVHPAE